MQDSRTFFDTLVQTTISFDESLIPKDLFNYINQWHWGHYGWISPASLIITATLKKYLDPQQDICLIWAKDERGNKIENSYSMRSMDESITIPILAKYDLCTDFCSPNSGMQGSRAIEKMRSYKRLNTDFNSTQKTVFDLKLFAVILNHITKLNKQQALETLKFEICIAKAINKKRNDSNLFINERHSKSFDLLSFLSSTKDPELTKCVVAACFSTIYKATSLKLEGVSDYRTAADARAKKPGDLSLSIDNTPIVAIEVKDKSQHIDWNNIDRALKIMENNPSLKMFIFVLENRENTVNKSVQDIISSDRIKTTQLSKITILSLHDLYLLAKTFDLNSDNITKLTAQYLTQAPSIKLETKNLWIEHNK